MTVNDWLPSEAQIDERDEVNRVLDYEVIAEFGYARRPFNAQPFRYKNIHNWCIATNGKKHYAVGWNENPSIGWAFPIKRLKNYQDYLDMPE